MYVYHFGESLNMVKIITWYSHAVGISLIIHNILTCTNYPVKR